MTDFNLVVLSRREYRQLYRLGKSAAYLMVEPDILAALARYGFTEYQQVGIGDLGGKIFGDAVKISDSGKRYLLFRKQQAARRWGDRLNGFAFGALLVGLAWLLTLIPTAAP